MLAERQGHTRKSLEDAGTGFRRGGVWFDVQRCMGDARVGVEPKRPCLWHGLPSPGSGKTRVAHIQRACGYTLRPTLSIAEIEKAVQVMG